MVAEFRRHGLGVIADIVPNHMAIPIPESLNRQFWSVLRDGPESPFAHWFDIDWQTGGGRLLLLCRQGGGQDYAQESADQPHASFALRPFWVSHCRPPGVDAPAPR